MPPAFTPVIKMTLLAIWEEKASATVLASVSAPNSSWLAILEKIAVVTLDGEQGEDQLVREGIWGGISSCAVLESMAITSYLWRKIRVLYSTEKSLLPTEEQRIYRRL